MSLARFPALKKAIFNQYQLILIGGAAGLSALLANPLPLLLLLGAELITMPILIDRMRRRIDVEKKYANRESRVISQEEQYRELPNASRERFLKLKQLCEQVGANYRSLSPEGQAVVAEQAEKLDAILVSCLRRYWLLKRHADIERALDDEGLVESVEKLEQELGSREMTEREREAWEQNLSVKRELLESIRRNEAARATLIAELDTIESLLHLLLQKSLASSDAGVFASEIDDALAQAEVDAVSVREMEAIVGVEPMATRERLADSLKALPPPPPPMRIPEGSGRGRR